MFWSTGTGRAGKTRCFGLHEVSSRMSRWARSLDETGLGRAAKPALLVQTKRRAGPSSGPFRGSQPGLRSTYLLRLDGSMCTVPRIRKCKLLDEQALLCPNSDSYWEKRLYGKSWLRHVISWETVVLTSGIGREVGIPGSVDSCQLHVMHSSSRPGAGGVQASALNRVGRACCIL